MKRSLHEHLRFRNHAIFIGHLVSKSRITSRIIAFVTANAIIYFPFAAMLFWVRVCAVAQEPGFPYTTHQRPTIHAKKPENAAPTAATPITFDNEIAASKIAFTLRNSVSPQRYSIETMTG